jgi:plastocyanin
LVQAAACFSDHSDAIAPTGDDCPVPVSALGARKAVVAIRGYAFFPDTLRISVGTTVTWVNCDDVARGDAHTSTSDAGVWASPLFAEGQTFSRAFPATGTFPYHCLPHTNMIAVVIVQ